MNISELNSINYNTQMPNTPKKNATDKELMKVSQDFESIFIGQLYKEMKKSVSSLNKDNTLFKTSMAEDIFKDMLFDKYAQDSSVNSPLGLANMIYESLNQGKKYETKA